MSVEADRIHEYHKLWDEKYLAVTGSPMTGHSPMSSDRVIWKHLVDVQGAVVRGSNLAPLFVAWDQHGGPGYADLPLPTVWISRDKDGAETEMVELLFVGTGHDVPEDSHYIGSAICGPYVWHVYGRWS